MCVRECCYCEQIKPINEFYKRKGSGVSVVSKYTTQCERMVWCGTCGRDERFIRLKRMYQLMIARTGCVGFSFREFINWIDKTKYDELYAAYIKAGKPLRLAPSIDAIVPRALGGKYELANMQVITLSQNQSSTSLQGVSGKGVPKTGKAAKGVPKTGKNTKGLKRGPRFGKNVKGVIITNSITGAVTTYRTQQEAADAIGCVRQYITRSLKLSKPISGFPHLRASR